MRSLMLVCLGIQFKHLPFFAKTAGLRFLDEVIKRWKWVLLTNSHVPLFSLSFFQSTFLTRFFGHLSHVLVLITWLTIWTFPRQDLVGNIQPRILVRTVPSPLFCELSPALSREHPYIAPTTVLRQLALPSLTGMRPPQYPSATSGLRRL